MKTKRQNRDFKEFEITIIKIEHSPDCKNDIKHYFNYRKRLNNENLILLKNRYKASGLQVRINSQSSRPSFNF